MQKIISMACIFVTIVCTVYGQIIIKWRAQVVNSVHTAKLSTFHYLIQLFTDPFVISGLAAVVPAGVCWVIAIRHLELSYAYPFIALSFALVIILSWVFFNEAVTANKIIGVVFITIGVAIVGLQ